MTIPTEIWRAAPRIRDGSLRPLDLIEKCLDRIAQRDASIGAWVAIDADRARQAARELAREMDEGRYRGPLHGVPVGVKDIVDVAGFPTRAGSPLTDPAPRTDDAPVVAGLRDAGAVVLGKTVTTPFAGFDPSPTRNPLDPARTPGGSSSGSAAAVADRMCLGAVGTQTGGSLTRPATYCGVASFKPTAGNLSMQGIFPFSRNLDHVGPIGRSVADLVYLAGAMAGKPALIDHFLDRLRHAARPRLALPDRYFFQQADATVAAATERAIDRLAAQGASITPIALPDAFLEIPSMHRTIMAVDAAAVHAERFTRHRQHYGPQLAEVIEEGQRISDQAYRHALDHQSAMSATIDHLLRDIDALLTPATPTTAPATLATTGDPRFNLPWSYCGAPTVSVPCGTADDGMPVALQIIGPRQQDARLLATAQWCEQRLDDA